MLDRVLSAISIHDLNSVQKKENSVLNILLLAVHAIIVHVPYNSGSDPDGTAAINFEQSTGTLAVADRADIFKMS